MDIQKLPIEWSSNKKAWMTSQIMEEWLTALNGRMKMQNQHVLFFLENATCHTHIELSNVQLAWFPPNTTSVSKPMAQGIIRNVKVHYRKLLMQYLLVNIDSTSSASELARTVSVLDVVIWISQAVKKLLPETVTKCFEKAGFSTVEVTPSVKNENDQKDLQHCMNEAAFSNCNAEDYINTDKDVQTETDTIDVDVLVENFREN
ncbi:tigger transposable element-derived protein 6-like [Cryptotermes secundus]|uniref:tigger transposable element-derived protein 6-like n=1 Tax=Cryptotermes secundus TaxID=105785 RepID=UPI000CD7C939|nr:tigger transposable element-derived protein 6-like [Cryptotermes secundus]